MRETQYLFLATGGTGGHVFPAIAVAEYLQGSNYKLGISFDQRCAHLFPRHLAQVDQLILYSTKNNSGITASLKKFFCICLSCYKATFYFVRKRPKALLSFGGYATFPILLAATILCIPIFLHEQNTILGRVNTFFLPVAKKLFLSFPLKTTFPEKHIISGLPIRRSILNVQMKAQYTKSQKFRLTVIGGSQGADIFCQIIPKVISLLSSIYQNRIELYMQVREEFYSDVYSILKKTKCVYRLATFIHNIADTYRSSDLVITRAGASSLAEICTVQKAAIIVPLPSSKDNHQHFNAQAIAEGNALIVKKQDDVTEAWLKNLLTEFISDNEKIKQIQDSLHKKHNIHSRAAADIIKNINNIIY